MDLPHQIHAASQSWGSEYGLLEIPARKANNICRWSEAAKTNRRLSSSATRVLTSSYRGLRVNYWRPTHKVRVVDATDLRLGRRWQLSPILDHSLLSFSLRKDSSPPFTLKNLPILRASRSSSSSVCSSEYYSSSSISAPGDPSSLIPCAHSHQWVISTGWSHTAGTSAAWDSQWTKRVAACFHGAWLQSASKSHIVIHTNRVRLRPKGSISALRFD